MRRLLGVVLVLSVAVAVRPAGAAPDRRDGPRSVTVAYAPNPEERIVIDSGIVTGSPGTSVAFVELIPKASERALMVSATDDSGSPVRIDVHQAYTTLARLCGASEEPLPIRGGWPVEIEVFSGVCGGSVGVATRGIVEGTFFRRATGR